jgi:transposase
MKKFKEVNQHQLSVLPPSLDELVEPNHLVRIVDKFVSLLPSRLWDEIFSGGGAPSYHPALMLKVILYAYSLKIYSCRNIAKAIRQDITFMWLTGMQRPTFNTVNRFRTEYFKDILEDIFTELLDFLHGKGYISYQDFFVDGTILEANAGRYTHVWGKNTTRHKSAVKKRVKVLLLEIDKINQDEDYKYGDADLPERGEDSDISSEELRNFTTGLSDHLSRISDKKKKQKLKTIKNSLNKEADKLTKYEGQEDLLKGRNSYSKTDTDATFMRTKDDRLRAAYNAQISTENQFITNYSISQNASDTVTFPDHLEKIKQRGEAYKPNNYMGDSAYGSEENYTLLADHDIQNYLKYNMFHPENSKHFKKNNPFHISSFTYDLKEDCFICPAGKKLTYQKTYQTKSKTGFISLIRLYEFQGCRACAYKPQCTKSKNNRQIHYNVKLEKFKAQARTNLDSPYGLALRKRRGFEVESFFGDLRQNCRFNRFLLRGLAKTEYEFGLLAIAHNLRKIARDKLKNVPDNQFINATFVILIKSIGILNHFSEKLKNFRKSLIIRDYSPVCGTL